MFCTACGKPIPQNIEECSYCQAPVIQPQLVARQRPLLSLLAKPLPFGLLIVLLGGLLVYGLTRAYRYVVLPDPTRAVQGFYEAIQAKDKQKALSFLHPDNREQGLGFNLELIMQPNVSVEYQDLKYNLLAHNNDQATVRISGKATVTLEGKMRQVLFNDEAKLVVYQRAWYIDSSSLGDLFVL